MLNKLLALAVVASLVACNEEEPKFRVPSRKQMEDINRNWIREEAGQIDKFVADKKWPVTKTGTGLRYYIYENGKGDSAKTDMQAEVKMTVTLLNGDTCYSWKNYGSEKFVIDHDHNESGLHEAIKHMRVGDKAKIILPSYLAFGVSGDSDRIPRQSTVVYDLELVSLK